jgi:hypothetical protein
MALLQRIRAQDAGEATADLFAADYVGALAGGLAFPFLLLPVFGQVRGALVVAMVNLLAAVVVVVLLAAALSPRERRAVAAGVVAVAVVLGVALGGAGQFLVTARQALYDDPVVVSQRSAYQEIVVTQALPQLSLAAAAASATCGCSSTATCSSQRRRAPLPRGAGAPASCPARAACWCSAAGDGLAAREVLRHDSVERLVEVELDPAVSSWPAPTRGCARPTGLARRPARRGRRRRRHALAAHGDRDLRRGRRRPARPRRAADREALLAGVLRPRRARARPGGRLVVQAGSPYFAPEAFWCIAATVEAAGLRTTPYHVDVPSFGDWGFVLAARGAAPVPSVDPAVAERLRFLDGDVLAAATVFPRDVVRRGGASRRSTARASWSTRRAGGAATERRARRDARRRGGVCGALRAVRGGHGGDLRDRAADGAGDGRADRGRAAHPRVAGARGGRTARRLRLRRRVPHPRRLRVDGRGERLPRAGAHAPSDGRALYEPLLARLVSRGFRTAVAGMALPNDASVGLHRALGFEEVGTYRRAGWKHGRWHDVLWVQRALVDGDGPPAPLR